MATLKTPQTQPVAPNEDALFLGTRGDHDRHTRAPEEAIQILDDLEQRAPAPAPALVKAFAARRARAGHNTSRKNSHR